MLKLLIEKPGQTVREIEGWEAWRELRAVLKWASAHILMPEPPYTGIVRQRIIKRLRNGQRVWTHAGPHGEPTDKSTVLVLSVEITVIK